MNGRLSHIWLLNGCHGSFATAGVIKSDDVGVGHPQSGDGPARVAPSRSAVRKRVVRPALAGLPIARVSNYLKRKHARVAGLVSFGSSPRLFGKNLPDVLRLPVDI